MRGDELMSVDMLLIDTKSVLIINLAPVLKTILDGSRSKQSFRFADTPVSLLFEEVPESINFIHKELFRFQGYEELIYFGKLWVLLPLSRRNTKDSVNYGQPLHPEVGDDNPGHDMPGAGAVTTDPSQSVERGIHDNRNRPSNHVMVESHPCFI
ncbi:BnaCnng21480D [Brassica napus]|uniref:BnaCnng21480D protein n=1 Tax=Brassica napus TaxID=3708 RepID=A0A078IR88_BRANA|nr:BnaCnng21480D [Brassica napus]